MLKGTTSTPNITRIAAPFESSLVAGPMSLTPPGGFWFLASRPLLVLLAVLLVASCLPDSPSASFLSDFGSISGDFDAPN